VEAYKIICAIKYGGGYRNHPVVKKWRDHINALTLYYNYALDEWISHGYKNRMEKMPIHGRIVFPKWVGNEKFHATHRSNLLRNDPVRLFVVPTYSATTSDVNPLLVRKLAYHRWNYSRSAEAFICFFSPSLSSGNPHFR
jgi:hypothetical protein